MVGLDIIRIVSMIFVIMVHVLGVGSAIASAEDTVLKSVLCFLQGVSLCCINLFAMSSGFLHYGRKLHISGLMRLCLEGLIWILATTAAYAAFKQDMTIFTDNLKDYLLVITKRQYWYLTDYVVLFFLIPFLNAAVEKVDLKPLTFALICILFVTSVITTVFPYVDFVSRGYSAMWLAIMYLVGAYIKKYDVVHRANALAAVMFFLIFALLEGIYSFLSYTMGYDLKDYYYKFTSYNCIFVVGASVALFIALAKINFKSNEIKKLFALLSSASFTVYLVHASPMIYDNCIVGRMSFIGNYDLLKALGALAAVVFAIYFGGTVLGLVQNLIFKILHIPNLLKFLENTINMCYDFLYRRCFGKLEINNSDIQGE